MPNLLSSAPCRWSKDKFEHLSPKAKIIVCFSGIPSFIFSLLFLAFTCFAFILFAILSENPTTVLATLFFSKSLLFTVISPLILLGLFAHQYIQKVFIKSNSTDYKRIIIFGLFFPMPFMLLLSLISVFIFIFASPPMGQ